MNLYPMQGIFELLFSIKDYYYTNNGTRMFSARSKGSEVIHFYVCVSIYALKIFQDLSFTSCFN